MLKYEMINMKGKYKIPKVKYPTSVYIKITTECMLKCEFCSQAGNNKETMKFNSIKKILINLKKIGVLYIYYTGGEPLMHEEIEKILEYGYELGFKQFLVTNGVLLNIKKNIAKYLIGVGISLHGKEETHNKLVGNVDCFEKILKNIQLIRKQNSNIQININCTVTQYNSNKEDLEYLAKLCKKNNYKFSIARLNYIGNGCNYSYINLNHTLRLVEYLKEKKYEITISNCIAPCVVDKKFIYFTHGCGAGQTISAIESNGDVKICSSSNNVIGNIFKKSFIKIWNSNKMKKYKKMKWISKDCRICKYFLICRGGCKAELTGEFDSKMCDATVENFKKILWSELKDKPIKLAFEYIRKEKFKYIVMGANMMICNNYTKKILMEIDGKKTGEDIVNNHINIEQEVKELLIFLRKENLIYV